MNINWKKWRGKLLSPKFWAAVAGFVAPLLVALNISEMLVGHVVAIVSAVAVLISYIIGETIVECKEIEEKQDDNT